MNIDNIQGAVSLDGTGATVATLNLMTSGTASVMPLTAVAVTNLNVSGTTTANLAAVDLAALTTVVVTETAGVTLGANSGDLITSADTTGTTGTNNIQIDGTVGTYTGGAGVDNVTALATAGTKAIDLGAGDDSATLAAGVQSVAVAGSIEGGAAGTDTLIFADTTDAAVADNSGAFALEVTGFERLTLGAAATGETIDVTVLGNYNYVNMLAAGTGAIGIAKLVSDGTSQ